MPADRRAGLVFRHQKLFKGTRVETGESGGLRPNRAKNLWNGLRLAEFCLVKVVAPAERNDAPLAGKSMEFERLER